MVYVCVYVFVVGEFLWYSCVRVCCLFLSCDTVCCVCVSVCYTCMCVCACVCGVSVYVINVCVCRGHRKYNYVGSRIIEVREMGEEGGS